MQHTLFNLLLNSPYTAGIDDRFDLVFAHDLTMLIRNPFFFNVLGQNFYLSLIKCRIVYSELRQLQIGAIEIVQVIEFQWQICESKYVKIKHIPNKLFKCTFNHDINVCNVYIYNALKHMGFYGGFTMQFLYALIYNL